MSRLLARLLVLVFALALAAPHALAGDEADKKAVVARDLLALTKTAELMVVGLEGSIDAQRAAIPGLPAEFWTQLSTRARRDMPLLVEMLVPVYTEHFTLEQLQGLVAFYKTPVGQHLIAVQPQITQEAMGIGQRWGEKLGAEIAADLMKNPQ